LVRRKEGKKEGRTDLIPESDISEKGIWTPSPLEAVPCNFQ
jgi:hypothetical protein